MYERVIVSLLLKNRSIQRAKLVYPISESIKLSKFSHIVYKGFGRTTWQIIVQPVRGKEVKELEGILEQRKESPEENSSYIFFNRYKIHQWPTPHIFPTIQHISDEKKEITFYGELEEDAWYGNGRTPLA